MSDPWDIVNGTYSCENDKTLNGIMKQEFGFRGYIMSGNTFLLQPISAITKLSSPIDWWATHSTTAVNFGLDVCFPALNTSLTERISDDYAR